MRRDILKAGLLILAGLPGATLAEPAAAPLKVVTTFSILADFTRIVGAEQVEVHSLVGPDSDAHVYEPTPADLGRIAAADVLVINGLGFDPWVDRLRGASGFRGRLVVATMGVRARRLGDSLDPHAWQDLGNARTYVLNIAAGLTAARPNSSQVFAARAQGYNRELERLAAECQRAFAAIPAGERVVLTSHDAFGYLGAAYDLVLLAPQGISTHSEPTAAQVAGLIRQIRAGRVKAVFLENIRDDRVLMRIAAEGGVRVGGKLYSDALGTPGSGAGSFLEMYRHNMKVLLDALLSPSARPSR